MGQAKQRRLQQQADPIIYYHTSILRTNLIWMAGQIEVEGRSAMPPFHPHLGKMQIPNATLRRGMTDFPAVAWFTRRIEVPRCLIDIELTMVDKETGEFKGMTDVDAEAVNAVVLNRVAIGFRAADTTAVAWPEYRGYHTTEGQELNASAREYGDDPDDWWISESPIDVMLAREVWTAPTIQNPHLVRRPEYLPQVKRMVQMCRDNPGSFVPPTWMSQAQAAEMARRMGVPAR